MARKKKPAKLSFAGQSCELRKRRAAYLSALEISENSDDSLVPRLVRIPTRATAINEAMRAYSMAVAPDSLPTNALRDLIITGLLLRNFLPTTKGSSSEYP